MPDAPKTISIIYHEGEAKPSIPANGAWGGPSPDGATIFVHLYTEYGTIPSAMKHAVGPDGVVDLKRGDKVQKSDITREVLATLVLAPENARAIGGFLVEKAEEAIRTRARITEDKDPSTDK